MLTTLIEITIQFFLFLSENIFYNLDHESWLNGDTKISDNLFFQ
jgi:hypothetical protein